jgi:hypothetical protein
VELLGGPGRPRRAARLGARASGRGLGPSLPRLATVVAVAPPPGLAVAAHPVSAAVPLGFAGLAVVPVAAVVALPAATVPVAVPVVGPIAAVLVVVLAVAVAVPGAVSVAGVAVVLIVVAVVVVPAAVVPRAGRVRGQEAAVVGALEAGRSHPDGRR